MEEEDIIDVAVDAGRQVMVHARGNPAQIVAVGVAATATVLAVAIGYGCYEGGRQLLNLIRSD